VILGACNVSLGWRYTQERSGNAGPMGLWQDHEGQTDLGRPIETGGLCGNAGVGTRRLGRSAQVVWDGEVGRA